MGYGRAIFCATACLLQDGLGANTYDPGILGLKWYNPAEILRQSIQNLNENQGFQLPADSLGKAYRGVPLCTDLWFSLNY